MAILTQQLQKLGTETWRNYAIFCAGFFLISTLLTAFVVIPKINLVVDAQQQENIQADLNLEAGLFIRFIEQQRRALEGLSQFPSITNAAMLADASNANVQDFFENIIIEGAKGRLILQDIAETVLIQTTSNLHGRYFPKAPWSQALLTGATPYYFKLLEQNKTTFSFQLSIPVKYNGYIEGLLSAEITVPFQQAFSTVNLENKTAIRLSQESVIIQTDTSSIQIPHEASIDLHHHLRFTYITDYAPVLEKENSLKVTILITLLIGFLVSFLLFALLGYFHLINRNIKPDLTTNSWTSYSFPLFVGMIGIAATIASYLIVKNTQQSIVEKALIADAKLKVQMIRETINGKLEILDATQAFYLASQFVDRQKFHNFAALFLSNHSDIKMINWIPYVPHKKRAIYEKIAQNDGFRGFNFQEKSKAGNMIPANKRENYFPAFYIEPLANNEKVLGFDFASNDQFFALLNQAKKTGKKFATAHIALTQNTRPQSEILIFNPIYQKSDITLEQEALAHNGFLLLVLRIEDMIHNIISQQIKTLPIFIQDVSNTDQKEILYGEPMTTDAISYSEIIPVVGRQWRITVSKDSKDTPKNWVSWFVLAIGLLFSTMIGVGLQYLIRRRQLLENLVDQRTEELSRLVDKLNDSNEELSRFAFVCSHDLQEPLRMIRSFSEKLQIHIADQLEEDERGKRYFGFIIEGATRAQQLIEDILTYSSIDGDTQNLQTVEIEELIRIIDDNRRINIGENKGTITYDKLPTVQGNKTQLSQLFQNLINNGLKYQHTDRQPNVQISVDDAEEYWQFSVIDNGIGIEERHLKKIFDVFQRLHRKNQFAGTGIGLSICKKVVKRHGGTIWATSQKGIGSKFYFTLPKGEKS